jgi:hypothetical protein
LIDDDTSAGFEDRDVYHPNCVGGRGTADVTKVISFSEDEIHGQYLTTGKPEGSLKTTFDIKTIFSYVSFTTCKSSCNTNTKQILF